MAAPHVMDALHAKRTELSGTVSHLEQQIVQHRASFVHLDAAMRLFDPDLAPEAINSRPQQPRSAWFHPGECLRLIHDVLREASQPMTTRALTEQVMGMKAIATTDERSCALVQKKAIRGTLHDAVRQQLARLGAAQGRIVMLDALLKLRQVCCDLRLVKLPSVRLVAGSSKLDDLMDMIGEKVPEGRRILLFSQFTSMLNLVKPRLAEAGIGFVELRGDTRDRAEPVRAFENGEVPLFLISLKAGGRGLNLTSADTVIHYDPWWNPAAEEQASDQAHRIDQTKPVFVNKLIAADTVKDRILQMQQRKADLVNIALSGNGELAGLDVEDLDFLFGDKIEPLTA